MSELIQSEDRPPVEVKRAKHTALPWKLEICRFRPGLPPFGFALKADGKIPHVASAGAAQPNHATVIADDALPYITTGFSAAELEANAEFICRAANSFYEMRDALQAAQKVINAIPHEQKVAVPGISQIIRAAIAKATK